MAKVKEYIELPGLVDLHVHFREPGTTQAETIESGTRAALLGGYALVADMPNNPGRPTWTAEAMMEKHTIARQNAYIPVGFYAGWQPDSGIDPGELQRMSDKAVGLKLYGAPTTGNDKEYEAYEFLTAVSIWHEAAPEKPIMFHAGQNNLNDMVDLVAKQFGHHLHVCHVSSFNQAAFVFRKKGDGLSVSSGVTPHHLLKTSHDVHSEGWFARMQPPLAEQADSEQLMRLLADGYIDVVETDHAPHSQDAKWQAEFNNPHGAHAPGQTTCFGVPGIEFAAPLLFYQVHRGRITMERLVRAMSTRPAEIVGVQLQHSTKFTWEMEEYRIDDEGYTTVSSLAQWTPYLGKLARGVINSARIGGKEVMSAGDIIDQSPRVVSERGEVV